MKPKSIIFIGLFLLALFVLIRCGQSGLSVLPPGIDPSDSIAAQWFPDQKGDSWTYQVTDTIHHATLPNDIPPGWSDTVQTIMVPDSLISGTLKITIGDTATLRDGSKATIWQNVWPQDKNLRWLRGSGYPRIDSTWVMFAADSVKQYAYIPPDSLNLNNWIAQFTSSLDDILSNLYIFPLDTGKSWQTRHFRYRVVSRGSLTVPAGTFSQVYRIEPRGYCCNSYMIKDIWFKKGVGVIQAIYYEDHFGQPQKVQTWKLVSYDIQ